MRNAAKYAMMLRNKKQTAAQCPWALCGRRYIGKWMVVKKGLGKEALCSFLHVVSESKDYVFLGGNPAEVENRIPHAAEGCVDAYSCHLGYLFER